MDLFGRMTLSSDIIGIYYVLKLFWLFQKALLHIYCVQYFSRTMPVGKEKIGVGEKKGNLAAVSA